MRTRCSSYTQGTVGNLRVEKAGNSSIAFVDQENRLIKEPPFAEISSYTPTREDLTRSMQEFGGSPTTYVWDGSDYLQERS